MGTQETWTMIGSATKDVRQAWLFVVPGKSEMALISDFLKNASSSFNITPYFKDNGCGPVALVNFAKSERKGVMSGMRPRDCRVLIASDVDSASKKEIARAKNGAAANGFEFYISDPSLEYWALGLLNENSKKLNQIEAEARLSKKIGVYRKGDYGLYEKLVINGVSPEAMAKSGMFGGLLGEIWKNRHDR